MIKVLHIMCCNDIGGISTVVRNYYKYIDHSKIHFDIALTVEEVGINANTLSSMGARVFYLPAKSKGLRKFESCLEKLLKTYHYNAIHVHENQTSYVALRVAKKCGIKCRIAHSHTISPSASVNSEIKRLSGLILNYHYATKLLACGTLAGERVFGKRHMKTSKAIVLPNAIEVDLYKYDKKKRETIRNELGIDNRFVIGMVSRLSEEKNHSFILNIMGSVHREMPEAILVIVGDGEEKENLAAIVNNKKMNNYVKFLGKIHPDEVAKLYSAFDLFLLPSKHEGFALVAVEAIASGVKVLVSDQVPREIEFSDCVEFLALNSELWTNSIVNSIPNNNRESAVNQIIENNLDISKTAESLETIYLESIK